MSVKPALFLCRVLIGLPWHGRLTCHAVVVVKRATFALFTTLRTRTVCILKSGDASMIDPSSRMHGRGRSGSQIIDDPVPFPMT